MSLYCLAHKYLQLVKILQKFHYNAFGIPLSSAVKILQKFHYNAFGIPLSSAVKILLNCEISLYCLAHNNLQLLKYY